MERFGLGLQLLYIVLFRFHLWFAYLLYFILLVWYLRAKRRKEWTPIYIDSLAAGFGMLLGFFLLCFPLAAILYGS